MRQLTARLFVALSLLITPTLLWAQPTKLSLSGAWSVQLDQEQQGVEKRFFDQVAGAPIALPGTLDQAGLGTPTSGAHYGILSRKHQYIGPAWYNRWIEIPQNWSGKAVELYLERVMWESQVWVDGTPIGAQDGLGTPHLHTLGKLQPGRHLLSIRVNNEMIHNIGDKGHCYGEYTQIIWNGMVGPIELRAIEDLSINRFKVWPDVAQRSARLTFEIKNQSRAKKATLHYTLRENATGRIVHQQSEPIALTQAVTSHTAHITPKEPIALWDEFTPNLYTIEATIKSSAHRSQQQATFGFREMGASKSKILVNDQPVFMRGNLDCLHFPLTGYPSCDVAEWEKIFHIYKAHGMNHVRFHSWCPPTAAFEAADRLGIYIQAEVLWIDWWMSIINPDRPEMTTKGLPKGLGHNPSADAFAQAELRRMVETYGNHPSFAMICIGNELGNSDFEAMQPWFDTLQKEDNRRLYALSTARRIMPSDQYMVTHNIPKVGGTYGLNGQGTDFDLEHNYSQASIPILAHELGQYPVYPLWSEIDKYTGVLEARNLMGLRDLATANGLENMDSAFHYASGELQTLLYKAMLENLSRTPSCAGFSMLSMTDYSGQGEALVGWLDSFWDSKGVVEPEVFRNYSNSIVLLSRHPRHSWQSGEQFTARIQAANYSLQTITEPVQWSITNAQGQIIGQGALNQTAQQGIVSDLGDIEFQLPVVERSEQLTLKVHYPKAEIENSWPLWLFAPEQYVAAPNILITEQLDSTAWARLDKGDKVLLLAHNLGKKEATTPLHFTPLFWSTSFFPGQSNETLGLYINEQHPALAHFPTQSHTNWQWKPLCSGRSFMLNDHPEIQPIVQPISDFHINNRLGSIFECKASNGMLLVSGHKLTGAEMEVQALRNSLLTYMNSTDFAPKAPLDRKTLDTLFHALPTAAKALPKGFENAVLYTNCGALTTQDGSKPWSLALDRIDAQQTGCNYKVTCDDTWRDAHGTAWTGRNIQVEITTPNGILGDLYVLFEDWTKQGRDGVVSIEGRESLLEASKEGKGQWIKLFVMREDTNDGKITFKARVNRGGNLMISQLAFVKQE